MGTMIADKRTILPRYVHIKSFDSGVYLSSTLGGDDASIQLGLNFAPSSQSQSQDPLTLFEAIPVENFHTSLSEVLEKRARIASAGKKETTEKDNRAGEKDHSTQSKYVNMYYFRNVQTSGVISFYSEGGSSLVLSKDGNNAAVCILMRLDGNIFRIVAATRDKRLLYISSSSSDDLPVVKLAPSAGNPDTKLIIEGGMSLRITDVGHDTENARVTFLPPLVFSVPLHTPLQRKKKKKINFTLPKVTGIWRNRLGYGVGPQAEFDTGFPHWVDDDTSSSSPRVEVGPTKENEGKNAIFGDKNISKDQNPSLETLLASNVDEEQVTKLVRLKVTDVDEKKLSSNESTELMLESPFDTSPGQVVIAHISINRYAIECEWTCRVHVIWHEPANLNGEINVEETGVYEGVSFGKLIVDYSIQ